jgi:hypothetical protein
VFLSRPCRQCLPSSRLKQSAQISAIFAHRPKSSTSISTTYNLTLPKSSTTFKLKGPKTNIQTEEPKSVRNLQISTSVSQKMVPKTPTLNHLQTSVKITPKSVKMKAKIELLLILNYFYIQSTSAQSSSIYKVTPKVRKFQPLKLTCPN